MGLERVSALILPFLLFLYIFALLDGLSLSDIMYYISTKKAFTEASHFLFMIGPLQLQSAVLCSISFLQTT